jgi:phosphomannomutase
MIDEKLHATVSAWILDDPDQMTAAALSKALADGDEAELRAAFNGFLQFGTAGLRGPIGAGPSRMNRAVVGRTALAAASALLSVTTQDTARINSPLILLNCFRVQVSRRC